MAQPAPQQAPAATAGTPPGARPGAGSLARLIAGLAVLAVLFAAGAYLYVHVAGRLFGRTSHLPAPLLLAPALVGRAASFFSPCSIAITPSFVSIPTLVWLRDGMEAGRQDGLIRGDDLEAALARLAAG